MTWAGQAATEARAAASADTVAAEEGAMGVAARVEEGQAVEGAAEAATAVATAVVATAAAATAAAAVLCC